MFTIVIAHSGEIEKLKKTTSVLWDNQKELQTPMQICVVNMDESSIPRTPEEAGEDGWYLPEEISLTVHSTAFPQEVFARQQTDISEGLVQFLLSGQYFSANIYQKIEAYESEENRKPALYASGQRWKGTDISVRKQIREIDLETHPEEAVLAFNGCIFRADQIQKTDFFHPKSLDAGILFLCSYLNRIQSYYLFGKTVFILNENSPEVFTGFDLAQDRRWYTETLCEDVLPLLETLGETNLQNSVRALILYWFRVRFLQNQDTRDGHVLEETRQTFWNACRKILAYLPDDLIINLSKNSNFITPNTLKIFWMKLKYGSNVRPEVMIGAGNTGYYLGYNGYVITNFASQKLRIDCMNVEAGQLQLEVSFTALMPDDCYELQALLNDELLPMEETGRYNESQYFGETAHKRKTALLRIPLELLEEKDGNTLHFRAKIGERNYHLTCETLRFPSRISSSVPNSYWVTHGYMIQFKAKAQDIWIRKYNKKRRKAQEKKLLKTIFKRSKRMFLLRCLYWMTLPYFKNKKIWLTFDKLYKGGDNGEYFYKYARTVEDEVIPKYIINRKYPDAKRLKKERMKPLYFGTRWQQLHFLHSQVVAATHANIPVFSGIKPAGFPYVQDLFQGEVVCIQHGLAVQQLAHNLNAQYDNLKRFYCASPYEIRNLSQEAYGYYDKSRLKLTGVPRYDGLKDCSEKQILIIPTWRAYISMPTSIGNVRPYSPTFRNTRYFQIYNELINDPRLLETAKKQGYRLIYLLHPTITSQIGDYSAGEGVEVLAPVNVSYEAMLTSSSLMVTDYSGVQFDFAYMRKPVVYYHPEDLPPHYEEGGFFYDTQGFGEICKEKDQLVDVLCQYMERDCKMGEAYRKRADDFFAFRDDKSCQRIYESLKELVSEL